MSKLARPAAYLFVIFLVLALWSRPRQQQSAGDIAAGPCRHQACRQLERQRYGRARRTYVKGKTAVHVAAVSSGDVHPYPLVNNTERWNALRDSCPYPFTILGQNETWTGDKSVTNNKLFFYMKWLRTLPPEDVVIIVDAHDVLFFPCGRDVVAEYHKAGVDILFGADYNAFPDEILAQHYPMSPKVQQHGAPQRFLNCGGMIGYAEDILYYIARHFIQTGRGHEAFKDQRFWTDMFLAQLHKHGAHQGEEPTLGLDYEGRVFQMFRNFDKGCWSMDLKTKAVSAAQQCPDLYDSEACILHGPGFNKKTFWFEFMPRWRAANATLLY